MSRQEDIAYDFLENDRIWPPVIASQPRHPFVKALVDVLSKLPEEVYGEVSDRVSFAVEDARLAAVNIPFRRLYPRPAAPLTVAFDTIVVFHAALNYSRTALAGLLAHEIAHSFADGCGYSEDEEKADNLVRQWGLGTELAALRAEQQHTKINPAFDPSSCQHDYNQRAEA